MLTMFFSLSLSLLPLSPRRKQPKVRMSHVVSWPSHTTHHPVGQTLCTGATVPPIGSVCCRAFGSWDMIERVSVVWLVSMEPDRCPCECVSALRSREHPQRLYNERGMSADTGAVCVLKAALLPCTPTSPLDNMLVTSSEMLHTAGTAFCCSVHLGPLMEPGPRPCVAPGGPWTRVHLQRCSVRPARGRLLTYSAVSNGSLHI